MLLGELAGKGRRKAPVYQLLKASALLDMYELNPRMGALPHRQELLSRHPEAFADEPFLQKVLAEVEHSVANTSTSEFPGLIAISYCWLSREHPDPNCHTMRHFWLPALQWYMSERAATRNKHGRKGSFYDFAVFIDFTAMPQKQGGVRTPEEDSLFAVGISNLDLMYAHSGIVSFLTTALPPAGGKGAERSSHDQSMPTYDQRGWPTFERAEGEMGKPSHHVLDISTIRTLKVPVGAGKFNSNAQPYPPQVHPAKFGSKPTSQKTVTELEKQASCRNQLVPGVMGALTSGTRRAPRVPGTFFRELETKKFTNGADVEPVKRLYEKTARSALGSAENLSYKGLKGWKTEDYVHLGEAFKLCKQVKKLTIWDCMLGDKEAEALFNQLGEGDLPSLKVFGFGHHPGASFTDRGMFAVCGAIERGAFPNLDCLDPNRLGFGDAGLERLALALRQGRLPKLQKIYLQVGGTYKDRGYAALTKTLSTPGVLPELDTLLIVGRGVGESSKKALTAACKKHHPKMMSFPEKNTIRGLRIQKAG